MSWFGSIRESALNIGLPVVGRKPPVLRTPWPISVFALMRAEPSTLTFDRACLKTGGLRRHLTPVSYSSLNDFGFYAPRSVLVHSRRCPRTARAAIKKLAARRSPEGINLPMFRIAHRRGRRLA